MLMVAAEAAASTHKSRGNQNNEKNHQLLAMLAIQQTSAESPTLSEKLTLILNMKVHLPVMNLKKKLFQNLYFNSTNWDWHMSE